MYCLGENLEEFVYSCSRYELQFGTLVQKISIIKGIRIALIAIGYSEHYVNSVVYDALYLYYVDGKEDFMKLVEV